MAKVNLSALKAVFLVMENMFKVMRTSFQFSMYQNVTDREGVDKAKILKQIALSVADDHGALLSAFPPMASSLSHIFA